MRQPGALSKREVFERAAPATLLIVISDGGGTSVGSGVLIDGDGLVVTNFHVIENVLRRPSRIRCYLPPPPSEPAPDDLETYLARHGGRSIPCKIGTTAPDVDLAFLHLETREAAYPFIPLGECGKVHPGDDVVCIGNPHGLVWTMTAGSISANRENALQITAPISPGNSGGPLLNMAGELIGVNSFVHARGQNLNFARPSRLIRHHLGQRANNIGWRDVEVLRPRGVEWLQVARRTVGEDSRLRVSLQLDTELAGGSASIEGATAGLIIESSFRTYASWWRSGIATRTVATAVGRARRLGLPGIHVWLACTRGPGHEYLGLFETEGSVLSALGARFQDAQIAFRQMSTDRMLLPALKAFVDRHCAEHANVVIGVLGESPFDDDCQVDEWVTKEAGRNTESEPYRLALTICTFRSASGFQLAGLGRFSRFAVIDHDDFVSAFERELSSCLVCVGTDGTFAVDGPVTSVRDLVTQREIPGGRFSAYDVVPRRLALEVGGAAQTARAELSFSRVQGDNCTVHLELPRD